MGCGHCIAQNWAKRGAVLAFVVLAHAVAAYVLATHGYYWGAPSSMAIMIVPIDPAPVAPVFEIPAAVLQKVQVYVPVPEYVDSQPPVDTDAITASAAEPSPVPTDAVVATLPHEILRIEAQTDPRHPLSVGEEYYPAQSKRAGEEGACRVQITVKPNGAITSGKIVRTSGFERLDAACLQGVLGQRMLPATEDGTPVESTTVIRIHWGLRK